MYKPKHFNLDDSGIWPGNNTLKPYVFNDEIAIAVDVAFAINRPLLISGPPGSGKSVLAPTMAAIKDWRFLSHTFTSRTRIEDLTGDLDQLRRLSDAQAVRQGGNLPPKWSYLEPGVLWWAFNPQSAANRGATDAKLKSLKDKFPEQFQAPQPPAGILPDSPGNAILLFDEIDKAEPDIPNDLLEPLENKEFPIPQRSKIKTSSDFQLIITTNGERELPPAFLRRCIRLHIKEPDEQGLVNIAAQHYPRGSKKLHTAIAGKLIEQRIKAKELDIRPPSTSEYLDAIKACTKLRIKPNDDDEVWQKIANATMVKESTIEEEENADEEIY